MLLSDNTRKIVELIDKAIFYSVYKKRFEDSVMKIDVMYNQKQITIEQYKTFLNRLLQNKTRNYWAEYYLKNIRSLIQEAINLIPVLNTPGNPAASRQIGYIPKPMESISQPPEPVKSYGKSEPVKTKKTEILKDLKIQESEIEDIKKNLQARSKDFQQETKAEYITYKPSGYGSLANRFFEGMSASLIKKYPETFKDLFFSLNLSGMKIFSKTYVSMILMNGVIGMFAGLFLMIALSIKNPAPIAMLKGVMGGVFGGIIASAVTYYYPSMLVDDRKRSIKNNLPFAIIHMAAVAGSGAQPITIFEMLLDNKEYGEVANEIKRLMNYVNIFGYNLTTALRVIANTTPSRDFSELLNGVIATLESGGDLKEYLKGKAEDGMNSYRLERKKYVESLATYSDMYTALLIAGPLLFVVVLAIMNAIPDMANIGGISINIISMLGVFGLIPFLNIVFMIFLNITHLEL